jgi:hypothetical protein
MSPTVTAPDREKSASPLSHPLVVSVLTPVLLAMVFGAGTVWMTQAALSGKVETLKADVEANKAEAGRQVLEIKTQIVPRVEHEAHWKATEDKLDALRQQGAHTNERVDKIYDLLVGRGK